jgi:hypothetical protein
MNDAQPIRNVPYRSPIAISDFLKDILKDKVVCDLGCAEGDNMIFMARYAKKVIGIEKDPPRYKVAQKRGLEVIVADYRVDPIPKADVYYVWPNDGEKDNEFLVNKILDNGNFAGVIVVAGDTGFPPEIPSVKRCSEKGRLATVEYDEGQGHRENGTFLLAIIGNNEE